MKSLPNGEGRQPSRETRQINMFDDNSIGKTTAGIPDNVCYNFQHVRNRKSKRGKGEV